MTKRLFVMMYDPTQQVCPVEADTVEEARVMIAEGLGISITEAAAWPIYDGHNEADLEQIMDILARHVEG